MWFSQNGTSASPTFNVLNAYMFAHPMRTVFNPYNVDEIWVTSFGNGLKVGNTLTTGMSFSGNPTKQNRLFVFPNPSNGLLYLENHTAIKTIQIYDVVGRNIMTLSSNFEQIQLKTAGVYYVTAVLNDGSRNSQKVIIK